MFGGNHCCVILLDPSKTLMRELVRYAGTDAVCMYTEVPEKWWGSWKIGTDSIADKNERIIVSRCYLFTN